MSGVIFCYYQICDEEKLIPAIKPIYVYLFNLLFWVAIDFSLFKLKESEENK